MILKSISAIAIAIITSAMPALAQNTDSAALALLHRELLEAHRANDVARWMKIEADDFVSVNGGRVSFPATAQRESARRSYLGSATFDVYADLRPPIIAVSADGTLGWLIAEVEVKGRTGRGASAASFHDIWAWVELYQKIGGEWRMTGNASNRRAPPN